MALREVTVIYKGTPLKITGEQAALVSLTDQQQEVISEISSNINSIENVTSSIEITPSIIRATGAGTIAAGAYSFSVANVGSLSGVLLGVTIKPGEVINFDAGSLNNTYGAVSYDGTGTELLITVNS